MADIFMSYAREDLPTAKRLAEALEAEGWSVWWDRTIPPGKTWRQVIGNALEKARSVLVLWSRHSVESRWVMEEADVALNRGVFLPALIEDITPPLGFTGIQAADLTNWQEDKPHLGFTNLLLAVSEIAGPPLGIPEVVESNSQAVGGSVERENSVQEQVSHHERELLGRLRTEMMMAASSWDLRKAEYELDEHLAKYPHSPEARLLKDQLVVAAERSMRPEGAPSEEIKAGPPLKRKPQKLLIGALVGVALILLVGVLWYTQQREGGKAIPEPAVPAPPQTREVPSRPRPERFKSIEVGRDGMFIAYANGVVRDSKTGLEWVAGPDKDMIWHDAQSWVQSLDIDGGGWRMPTLEELKTLYKKGAGTRNMTPLLKTTGWYAWSGAIEGSSFAWLFNFARDGNSQTHRYVFIDIRAFAVRSRSGG